jgi:diadenylate cyclase
VNTDLFSLSDFFRAVHSYPPWVVLTEWLLIGFVVYWVIRFLRGTRGARLLKGIGLVLIVLYLVVHLIGERFGLQRIDFLYSQFLFFASFAFVIVFQPELRRALMRLGETRLFHTFSGQLDDDISELVASATFLSRNKIGALIAIERETPLHGSAENGTRLNAELSAALLNTIFWPNSPLHDLGVIVGNGRVLYASVQFPLAEVGDIDRELGSRHRAAVGLSQDTDAVVIVVSEETGDISIADHGKLMAKLTPDQLRSTLRDLLGRGEIRAMHKAAA